MSNISSSLYYNYPSVSNILSAEFYQRIIEGGDAFAFRSIYEKRSDGDVEDLLALFPEANILRRADLEKHVSFIFEYEGTLFYATSAAVSKQRSVDIASSSQERVEAYKERIRAIWPSTVPATEDIVPVKFWYHTPNGSRQYVQNFPTGSWDDIAANYPEPTRGALAQLMSYKEPPVSGKIVLAYGQPGVGKTFSLLTLARCWSWARIHYVIDADKFFSEADYMVDVILQGQDDDGSIPSDESGVHVDHRTQANVVVIEDADELITKDAKNRVGQAFSKLLNLTDGFVGRSLKTFMFITTNEDIGRVHPAINRPGRCLANIKYHSFNIHEQEMWLAAHDAVLPSDRRERTLAELYEMLGTPVVTTEVKSTSVGFQTAAG